MISNGSIITYNGRWPKAAFSIETISELTGLVTRNFSVNGLTVRDAHGQIDSIASTSYAVQLTLQVENGVGFELPDDIISIIRHWVYLVTGDFPLSDSIPEIKIPGAVSPTPTGQPVGTLAPGEAGSTDACSGISGFFSCLTQKSVLYLGIIGIGVGLGVVLILNTGGSIGIRSGSGPATAGRRKRK